MLTTFTFFAIRLALALHHFDRVEFIAEHVLFTLLDHLF